MSKLDAKAVLADAEAFGYSLVLAVKQRHPELIPLDGQPSPEPETLWLSLPNLHDANREKLLAALACITSHGFWAEPRVFTATVEALNGHVALSREYLSPVPVADVAWAVTEAQLLHRLEAQPHAIFFTDEIVYLTALQALNEGFVTMPQQLLFAEEALQDLLKHFSPDKGLQRAVQDAMEKLYAMPETQPVKPPETDSAPFRAQLEKQCHVENYVRERTVRLRKEAGPLEEA